jgi:cation diffusion facilitator family transporter
MGRNVMRSLSTGTGATKLAMVVIIGLIVLKVIVSVISNSISIVAQTVDSVLDVFSISITLVALRMSGAPADRKHPFGYGKAEGLCALLQAVLVLGAGCFIVYSAIQRIINGAAIDPDEGIVVMVISILASFFLSRHLRRVAKATDSTAVDASARNIGADVYSAAGVLVGLLLVRTTGLVVLDPIIAVIVAGLVLKAGYEVLIRALRELLDSALPKKERETLNNCLKEHSTQLVGFHAIRSRRSGKRRFIDLHILMPRYFSLEKAHDMCDHLERDIKDRIPNANVLIHMEPCKPKDCPQCAISGCDVRSP